MRWEVRLLGDESGLEELSKSFNDDPKVVEKEEEYVLLSSRFEGKDDVDMIREISEDIVRVIRAYGERDSINVGDLEASHVYKISDDGSKHVYVQAETATMTMSASATVTVDSEDGEEETIHPADRTYEWTKLAMDDEKVLDLAELLDKGESWVNLYRIYEFIQANIQDEDNILARGWWSESEKKSFKRTANSRDAIGDNARHGQDRIPAPDDPMTHAEAKRLIDTLVDHWLHHRK